jgi:hypothetical protein
MSGPPRPGQPWWQRPGGAPIQGRPPSFQPPLRQPVAPPPRPARQPVPPATPAPGAPKRPRRRMFVWAGVAIILVEAVVAVVALGFFGFFGAAYLLDVRQAEAGVQQILGDPINGYGANDVASVRCNDGRDPTIEQGEGFTCQVTINGTRRQVQVVFRDDAGTYEVDGPR